MSDRAPLARWGMFASALVAFVVFAVVMWAERETERSRVPVAAAQTPAESAAIRMRVVRLSGNTENFELLNSGRVLHTSDWDSSELRLPAQQVPQLARELLACGLCTLEPADPLPSGPSRRRIVVELRNQPESCSADLPWERWFEDAAARKCLDVITTALQPLQEQCGECTIPQPE